MKKPFILFAAALLWGSAAWGQGIANPAENASLSQDYVRVGEFKSTSRNNVGAASFLFPSGDKLVTGLHSSVPAETFLNGLKPVNSLYSQIDYNLVSYGWKGSRGFHTIEVGARVHYGLSVPKEIFQILKSGTAQSPYDLSAFRAFGNVYGELAYGYALPLSEKLSIGARAKLLVGLNSVEVITRKFQLTTTEEQYILDLDADLDLTSRNRKMGADQLGYLDFSSFSGKGKLGMPTGGGLAVDLGLVWKPFSGFSVSASVLDLGGILWYYGNAGTSSGSYTFEGLKNLTADDLNQDQLLTKLEETGAEVLALVQPKAVSGCFKWKFIPLNAQVNASYQLPFWKPLSVDASALYTGYAYCAPYWEARGGLSVDFPGQIQFGLNAGGGAYGFVYGLRGSAEYRSFRLYAAYENGTGGVIPYEGTPLQANNRTFTIGLIYLLWR